MVVGFNPTAVKIVNECSYLRKKNPYVEEEKAKFGSGSFL
jgi:hypothetical protein